MIQTYVNYTKRVIDVLYLAGQYYIANMRISALYFME